MRTIAGSILLLGAGLLILNLVSDDDAPTPIAHSIWGRVYGPDDHPVAFATVRLSAEDDLIALTHSDQRGFFRLSYAAPPGAPLTLEARGSGYEAGSCSIAADQESPVRLEMSAEHCLSLTVRYPDGDPVPGFRTVITSAPARPGHPSHGMVEIISDHETPDGRATIVVRNPVIDLVVTRPAHPPIRRYDLDLAAAPPDAPSHFDLRFARGGIVHGQVRMLEDWYPDWLRVVVTPSGLASVSDRAEQYGLQETWIAVRQKSVPFVINGLEPGSYEVVAVGASGVVLSSPVEVSIAGDQTCGPIELECGYPVPVEVTVAFGRARTGALVRLVPKSEGDADGRSWRSNTEVSTNRIGRAFFPAVPPGSYRARIVSMRSLGRVPWTSGPVDRQLRRLLTSVKGLARGLEIPVNVEGHRPQILTLDVSSCLDGFLAWRERVGREQIRDNLRALAAATQRGDPNFLEKGVISVSELPYYEIEGSLLAIEALAAEDSSALSEFEPELVAALRARDLCSILEALVQY